MEVLCCFWHFLNKFWVKCVNIRSPCCPSLPPLASPPPPAYWLRKCCCTWQHRFMCRSFVPNAKPQTERRNGMIEERKSGVYVEHVPWHGTETLSREIAWSSTIRSTVSNHIFVVATTNSWIVKKCPIVRLWRNFRKNNLIIAYSNFPWHILVEV